VTHSFKPVTTGEEIQVAILDELQQIRRLLEPPQEPADMEPKTAPADDKPAVEPEKTKPATSKKPPVKKAATRKRVTGQ
jgi:hypothetical protein